MNEGLVFLIAAILFEELKIRSLSEPAPMTPPVPFWMEGNSSIDFGFANNVEQFHFG
jgi:hypothetical protein